MRNVQLPSSVLCAIFEADERLGGAYIAALTLNAESAFMNDAIPQEEKVQAAIDAVKRSVEKIMQRRSKREQLDSHKPARNLLPDRLIRRGEERRGRPGAFIPLEED